MALSLVLGMDTAARRRVVIEIAARAAGESTIVCGTQALAHEVGRLLGRSNTLPWMPVYSWRRWVEGLWITRGDGRTPVDEGIRGLTIAQAVAAREGVGQQRDPDVLDSPGGVRLLARFVAAFPSSRLSEVGPELGYRPLVDASKGYHALIASAGYVEFVDIESELAAQDCASSGAVAVIGFATVTPTQVALLAAAAHTSEVILELPYRPNAVATRVNDRTIEILRGEHGASVVYADESGVCPGTVLAGLIGGQPNVGANALSSVERGRATLSVAEGVNAEVALIADLVEREIEGGTEPDKVSVIVSNLKTNVHRISAEFERRDLPHAINLTTTFSSTGFGSAMMQLIEVAHQLVTSPGGVGAGPLGPFLSSAYSGMRGDSASAIDAHARFARQSVASLVREIATGGSTTPGFGWASAVGQLFRLVGLDRDENELVARAWKLLSDEVLANGQQGARTSWWGSTQDARAHAAFSDSVAALQDSGTTITPDSLRGLLRQITLAVSPQANVGGLVMVTTPGAMGGRLAEVVVVGGLGLAGAGASTGGVAAERIVASAIGVEPAIDFAGERMLRDVTLLSSAQHKVHIVWKALDETGGSLEPSPLLEEVLVGVGMSPSTLHRSAKRAAQLRENNQELTPEERQVLKSQLIGLDGASEQEAKIAVAAAAHGRYYGLGSREVSVVRSAAHRDREAEYLAPAANAPRNLDRGCGPISFPEAYWTNRNLSPSAVELYARCPYRWFIERLVRANELDDDYSGATAGLAVHEALERFYVRWVRVQKRGELAEDNLVHARALFEHVKQEVVAEVLRDNSTSWSSPEYGGLVVELDVECAWNIIRDDAFGKLYPDKTIPFAPRYFEWKFGPGASHQSADPTEEREVDTHEGAIEIGGVPLVGSIDRIDVGHDPDTGEAYLSVLDYKSGNDPNANSKPNVVERSQLQVPIYLLAASRALAITPAFGGYVGYKKRKVDRIAAKPRARTSRSALTTEEFEQVLVDVEDRVREVCREMKGGTITPVEDEDKARFASCAYCLNWWCANHPKGER